MEFQDWLFDRRVLKRNIRKHVITRKDYLKYLKSLEDVSDNIADPEADEDLLQDVDDPEEPEDSEAEAAPDEDQ